MTIAAGLKLSLQHAIIIGADTQETFTDAKIEGQKIMADCHESGCVVFTGAGDAGYLDSLGQRIIAAFRDEPDATTAEEVKAVFEETIVQFYDTHVRTFDEAWVKNDNLAVSAVIGYQRGSEFGLFRSRLGAVTECAHAAVGTGQLPALSVLNPLRTQHMTVEAALRLVAFAVYQAKEYDPNCGKKTHLVVLKGQRWELVEPGIVKGWEDIFGELVVHLDGTIGLGLGVIPLRRENLSTIIDALDEMATRFPPSGIT